MTQLRKIPLAFIAIAAAYCAAASAQPVAPPAEAPAPPASVDAPAPVLETNPAIRAALEIPRKEPGDYFQAVIWLIDLDRPELAKPILDELTKLQLTDAQRATLIEQFGARSMLQLAQSKALAPAGAAFADACMNAAAAATTDPKRIAALVAQLADPSAEVRVMARNDLAASGPLGAVALLESLARERDANRRQAFMTAAAELEPFVVGPLIAMLETRDETLGLNVVAILLSLNAAPAKPFLSTPPGLAEQSLLAAIDRTEHGIPPFRPDELNRIELWQWNDETKKLTSTRYPADVAKIIWMARLVRELARVKPDNREYSRRALLLEMEAAALVATPGAPPAYRLQSADVGLLNQVLSDALASNYAHAAVAAADALGQLGQADVLFSADSQPTPLANALRHANRRVRFAALRAIMRLDPKSPYPGSSRVPDALAWFAGGTGESRVLVAMPTAVAATSLAGMLASQDLNADATDVGREAVDLAIQMPDLEMIFVDVNINGPGIRQVLYELRISPTTAEIPIVILAPTSRLAAAEQLASEHQRVIAAPRIHSAEVLGRRVEQLTALSGRFAVSAEERAAEAVEAMTWLAQLASGERSFYKIRRTEPVIEAALYGAAAAEPAISALAQLGWPESQRALANFASQPTLPIASRSQAADAFRKNVAANGLLLTSDEILTQYDRYNASKLADAQTQRVLGALLDVIESRRDVAEGILPLPPQP